MDFSEILLRSSQIGNVLQVNKIAELLSKFSAILAGFTFYSILTLIKEDKIEYKEKLDLPIKLLFVVFLSLILCSYLYIETAADKTIRIHFLIFCVDLILSISVLLMVISIIYLFSIYKINHGILNISENMSQWADSLIYIYMIFVIYDIVYIIEGKQLLSMYTIVWNIPALLFIIIYISSFGWIRSKKDMLINSLIQIYLLINIIAALYFAYIKLGKEEEIYVMYFPAMKYIATFILGFFLFSCKLLLPDKERKT